MNVAIAVAIVAVTALVFFWLGRRYLPAAERGASSPLSLDAEGRAVVVLEVEGGDPASPAVQRLVHEVAARTFASMPDAREVEVRTPSGTVLGRSARIVARTHRVEVPPDLLEPHVHRTHRPGVAEHVHEQTDVLSSPPPQVVAPLPKPEPLPLVRRFDLPPSVRVSDPNDPVELVRAILEAGGVETRAGGDVVVAGDLAVVVARATPGGVVDHDTLNHAFLEFQRSGAARGLVACFGLLDPGEVRRREALAPHVQHIGPDGIQRMADAVAVGADPLRYAVGPPLATGSRG